MQIGIYKQNKTIEEFFKPIVNNKLTNTNVISIRKFKELVIDQDIIKESDIKKLKIVIYQS